MDAPSSLDDQLATAHRFKEEGNALLNDGDYEEARAKYEEGLRWVDLGLVQMPTAERSRLAAVRVPLLLNATLCDLRMHPEDQTVRLHQSERRVAEVLAEQPENKKALFRRAQLHGRAGEYAMARSLLERLCQQDPSERAFRVELLSVVERSRKERKVTDRFWSAALDRLNGHHRARTVDDLEGGEGVMQWEHGRGADDGALLRKPWALVRATSCRSLVERLMSLVRLLVGLFNRIRLMGDRTF